MKHATIKIYGLVQGVTFRYWTKETAEELRLVGFVRNMPDGSVYIEAEGEEKNLKELILRCERGPHWAQVDNVEFEINKKIKNLKGFDIKY